MIENKKIFYENSIVVGAVINNGSAIIVNEFLDELCFLAETAGGKVLRRFIQKLEKPNLRFLDTILIRTKNLICKT